MPESKLEKFFYPRSVAVIGASADRNKVGYGIINNLIEGKYKGKIYPVNLKAKKIQGLKAYPTVTDIPTAVDLAVVVIPAVFVNGALRQCGEKGIRHAIVISSGFKETGKEGAKLEQEMALIAKEYDMQIIGPNCLGLADSISRLNASFANGMTKRGKLGFISQSGAICAAMLDWANANNVGFSRFVSIGNKAVVSETELLEFFKDDDETAAVLAYLEGFKDGKRFMRAAAELAKDKPLIIIKPGTSAAAQKAMQSHTGAMAGADASTRVALSQTGATRVWSMEELFDAAKFLSHYDVLKKNRIAIITNAGGPGVIATDEIEKRGLELAKLSKATIASLGSFLPAEANIHNPVDVLGDAKEGRFKAALAALAGDGNVDGIVFVLTPQKGTPVEKVARMLSAAAKDIHKPVVVSFIGGELVETGKEILRKSPLASYDTLGGAIAALGRMWECRLNREEAQEYLRSCHKNPAASELPDTGRIKSRPDFMGSLDLLASYGIPVVQSRLARTREEAVETARAAGYPVAMKISSKKISHKTEVEGVRIDIGSDSEAEEYFELMRDKLGADLDGMIVQPMVPGREIIVGMKRDDNFGPMLMFGLGGVYTEVIKDVAFRFAPIDHDEALEMMMETKTFKTLVGYREFPKLDVAAVADVLVNLSRLVMEHPEIRELDINPLMVMREGKGCQAVDIRISV